jgi:SPP1 family predicted phage head-tail adaptor
MDFKQSIGDMRHLVAYQTASLSRDSVGQAVETWSTQASVWAAIEVMNGRELANAQAIVATATTKLTTRYFGAISTKGRFVTEGGLILNIEFVNNLSNLNAYVVCVCTVQEGD